MGQKQRKMTQMEKTIKEIQSALLTSGCDPKGIDGVWGRDSQWALRKFQQAKGLEVNGIIGPKSLGKLFPDEASPSAIPPWYALALTKKGLQERLNNKELRAFLASDHHALGDPSVLPWCGDFVETCVALTLPQAVLPVNPYWAQNWVKFGQELKKGQIGAILVFGRTGGGHVGFYAGETESHWIVLGGNQSNAVTIMQLAKGRLELHGIRWPNGYPLNGKPAVIAHSDVPISKNEA